VFPECQINMPFDKLESVLIKAFTFIPLLTISDSVAAASPHFIR
jgi:hypothetical protein